MVRLMSANSGPLSLRATFPRRCLSRCVLRSRRPRRLLTTHRTRRLQRPERGSTAAGVAMILPRQSCSRSRKGRDGKLLDHDACGATAALRESPPSGIPPPRAAQQRHAGHGCGWLCSGGTGIAAWTADSRGGSNATTCARFISGEIRGRSTTWRLAAAAATFGSRDPKRKPARSRRQKRGGEL